MSASSHWAIRDPSKTWSLGPREPAPLKGISIDSAVFRELDRETALPTLRRDAAAVAFSTSFGDAG